MTKCGHVSYMTYFLYYRFSHLTQVFCLPCILHYLSMSNNNWARCPICFDSINDAQLKSVKWYDGSVASSGDNKEGIQSEGSSTSSTFGETLEAVPQAGSSLTMRLIERPQITTLALPRSPTWPSDLLPPHQAPYHFLPDVYNFAKFMLATPAYLISDLTRDLDALETERAYLTSINDALSLIFVEGAEQRVRDEVSKAVGLETPILKSKIERSQRELQELEERQEVEKLRRKASEFIGASGGALSDAPKELLASRGLDAYDEADPSRPPSQTRINIPRQRKNVSPPPPANSTYYYSQAASGLPLFLHPLDIKILLSHFRSYSSFPDVISIRVASVSEGTVNNDLQKRCKYLGHLPEGTDVVFIEADLKDVVGAEGLKNFEGPLKMRAARRKDKAKKDERARTRAEERERERIHAEAWSPPSTTTMHTTSYTDNAEDFPAPESESLPVSSSPPRQPTGGNGAWGNRTFASALHSSSPTSHSQRPGVGQHGRRGEPLEDEFDLDIDWHERVGNPGRNKRGTKIVLLGSGGAGARRR